MMRGFVFAFVLLGLHVAADWNASDCDVGGTCDEIRKGFIDVIEGSECRKLYIDGECNGLCERSVRSVISRSMWSKCAKRCDWLDVLTKGASSWLELCQQHLQSEDDVETDVERPSKRVERDTIAKDDVVKTALHLTTPPKHPEHWFIAAFAFFWIVVLFLYASRFTRGEDGLTTLDRIRMWFKRRTIDQRMRMRQKGGLGTVLDPGPDPSYIGERTKRARRHLMKALANQHPE